MENIERFNRNTVQILGILYDSFPVPIELDSSKFDDPLSFQSTVEFLQTSGYLAVGKVAQAFQGNAHFFFVVLTEKGLSVLNAVPSSLVMNESLGKQMVGIVKSGTKKVSLEAIKALVSELIKLGVSGST